MLARSVEQVEPAGTAADDDDVNQGEPRRSAGRADRAALATETQSHRAEWRRFVRRGPAAAGPVGPRTVHGNEPHSICGRLVPANRLRPTAPLRGAAVESIHVRRVWSAASGPIEAFTSRCLCDSVATFFVGRFARRPSRVADAGVLRQEEARQQDVDAEETVPRERHALFAGFAQVAFVPQAVELRREALEDVDAALSRKYCGRTLPSLSCSTISRMKRSSGVGR